MDGCMYVYVEVQIKVGMEVWMDDGWMSGCTEIDEWMSANI